MPELPSERPQLPFKIADWIDPTLVTAHAGGAAGDRAVSPCRRRGGGLRP